VTGTAPASTDPPPTSLRAGLGRAFGLIEPRARRRYLLVLFAQMAASLLDLLGVLLVGITVVLVYSVPSGGQVPSVVEAAVDRAGLADVPVASLAVLTGAAAAVLLLGKSALNAYMTHRIFRFLARQQARVAARLARAWFARDAVRVHACSDIEVEEALVMSTYFATTGLLGPAAVSVAEGSVLVVLSAALIVLDPVAALLAGATFAVVALGVHRVLGRWAHALGRESVDRSVGGRRHLRHGLDSYRELRVGRRLGFEIDAFCADVAAVARTRADTLYINNVPKIAYEAALVIGATVVVAWQAAQGGLVSALALLAVFLTAAARLLPTMVRLQGQVVTMKSAVAQAELAFDLARHEPAAAPSEVDLGCAVPQMAYPDFVPAIDVEDVSLTYAGAAHPALRQVSVRIEPGASLVLVGPTGAGKSTLVDVILGVIAPDQGSVAIGGVPPAHAQAQWPGAIAYMPQHSTLWDGSVRANVAVGLPAEQVRDDDVWRALEQAHLADDVRRRGGLDAEIGSSGRALSGGQRQRLGIARALYSRPSLLVLDEATSALDEETERLIGSMLDELRGEVTVLAVAHRRSTIERASRVAELREGRVVYLGPPAGAPVLAR